MTNVVDVGRSSADGRSPAAPPSDRPDRRQVLEIARSLVPGIRARVDECERLRRLPDATVEELRTSGLLRVATLERFGGFGLGLDTGLEVATELGRGCSSTAWVLAQYLVHNWGASRFDAGTQAEYFADSVDVTCATAKAMLTSTVVEQDDGIVLSGRWKFSSGIDHADWLWITRVSKDSTDGALVPRGDFEIADDWHTLGLKGTGSKEVVLHSAFVPRRRILSVSHQRSIAEPGSELYDEDPTHRLPGHVWGYWTGSCLIGTARAALERFETSLVGRRSSVSGRVITESPLTQVALAESSAEIQCAGLLFEHDMTRMRAAAEAGQAVGYETVCEVGRNAAYGYRLLLTAGQRLLEHFGSSVIYDGNPVGRLVGDLIAGTRHAVFGWEDNAEQYGRMRWGMGPLAG